MYAQKFKKPLSEQRIAQFKFAASIPVFLLSLFCNGINPMLAQDLLVPAKYTAGQCAALRQIQNKMGFSS